MGLVLELVEWIIVIGFGALVGALGGLVVLANVPLPIADARVLVLSLFTVAGIFTFGGIFAVAAGG